MGNFGCCQGKPQVDENQNTVPVPEPKQDDYQQESIKGDLLSTLKENHPPTVQENISEKIEKKTNKKSKPKKSVQVEAPKNQRRPSELPKISREDFVHIKKENIENSYIIISALGKGSFGCVYKAQKKLTNELRAVKVLQKKNLDSVNRKALLEEVEILKSLNHPNILKVFEVYEDSISINIITDLCTGGELFDRIVESKGFSENKAANYMYQLISAVRTCHDKGIVHRDLKPENILFINEREDSPLKVIDFGTSKKLDGKNFLSSLTGTVRFI